MKVTFSDKFPEGKKIYFQAEVHCTKEELESVIGYKLVEPDNPIESDHEFKGQAFVDGVRPMPLVINNWKSNHRDDEASQTYFWHIRTTFYQDGCAVRDYINSVLRPKEQ